MSTSQENNKSGISRRDALKLAGLSVGGMAVGGATSGQAGSKPPRGDLDTFYPTNDKTERYTYFDRLRMFIPGTPLGSDEMRITFLGSMIPPVRRA